MDSCIMCEYFRGDDVDNDFVEFGACVRYPPTVVQFDIGEVMRAGSEFPNDKKTIRKSEFPIVDAENSWCGEFEVLDDG